MKQNQYSDLMLDQTKDLIWAVDHNLILVYANRAYLYLMKEITGVEKELNTPILVEGFGEGYIEKWETYYLRALSGEYFEIEEHFYNSETKEIQYGHITFSPIRDESDKILTVACRSTDITNVVKQKDYASRLLDASLDVFCTIDEVGKFIYVSAASADHWGYHPEELIGKPFRDLIIEEDLEKTDQVAADVLVGREFKSFSNRYRKKNGDIAYNLWSVRWDPESKLMYCVARDVKEKIEEEHQLRLLEKVINSTTDPILITEAAPQDEPGPRIVYINEAFTKMTGYTAEEVIGKNPRFLQGPDSDYEELKRLGEKLRRWEPTETTILNYTKTGEPFWVNFAVSPVADEKGWYTHWISIQRDVTEQKKQESEKELLSQISLSFNSEEELIPAVNRLCENLYTFGKFDLIEIWCPNMEQTQLKLIAHSTKKQDFYELEPFGTSFRKNEGLLGSVWDTGKQLLWDEKQISKYFIRKKGASHLGLKAVLGIPLTFNDKLVGVLLIGTSRNPDYLQRQSAVLSRLEKFIGSEINRKRLENDLSNVFDAIPEILCITDFEGRFLKINNAGCALLGYTADEVLFHSLDEFTHKEDRGKFEQKIKDITKENSVFAFENRFLSKEGQVIWLHWNCNPAIEEGLVYASAKNITEEVQLRELNAEASEMAKIGSWELSLLDPENDSMYWSPMTREILEVDDNYNPSMAGGLEFYEAESKVLILESVEKLLGSGTPFDVELVIKTSKDNRKWIRCIGNAEFIDGKCVRIFGCYQDIHEQKNAEIKLKSITDNLPGVVFQYLLHPNGKDQLLYISEGSYKVWGLSPEECKSSPEKIWPQIEAGGNKKEIVKAIVESAKNLTPLFTQWKNVSLDKTVRWYEGRGLPQKLPDGSVLWNSLIIDITEKKEFEGKYQEASAEMTTVLESISDAFYAVDADWNFTYFNKEAENLLKKSAEEVLGRNKWEIFSPAKGTILEEVYRRVARTGQSENFEYHYPGDGSWYEITVYSSNGGVSSYFKNIDARRKVAQDLEKAYHERSNILESISDNFYALNSQFEISYMNASCAKLLQVDQSDILGKVMFEVFPELKDTEFEYQLLQSQRTNAAVKFEFYYEPFQRWFSERIYPTQDGFSIYFFDITDAKEAENAILVTNKLLAKSNEEKNEILERIGDAFFALDKHWNVTYWNKRAEEIIGIPREDLIGNNLWDIFPLAKELEFFKQYDRAFKTQTPVYFEEYFQPFNQWFEASGYPSPEGISVFFRDVTEKKLADTKILDANERFELVTKATNDAIWDWDIENDEFYRSNKNHKIFGSSAATKLINNQFWQDSFHPDDLGKLKKSIESVIKDPQAERWLMEYRVLNDRNEELSIIDRGIIVRNKDGKATRMVGAMTDITEQKKLEKELFQLNESLKNYAKELERSNEELEQFAFITSHDLQEPLRMISSFMDLLKKKYSDQLDEKALQYIHFATDGAKRMKQIILDLLLYSRANKPSEQLEEVNLNEIVTDYTELRRKLIADTNASIIFEALPVIETNKAPLTQVIHCLLDNALKYVKDNVPPRIEISAIEQETMWEFAVKDNGIGIDEQFYDKIFIIFQRLHNRQQHDGTGIGLSIAKRSVEFLGGEIWLESAVGEGSTFYFTIAKHK